MATSSLVRAILASGLLIGALDGVAAAVHAYSLRGTSPSVVFRYVASAVFGREAFTGGGEMVVWGVLFHLTVALGWTALYFVLAPRRPLASSRTVLVGLGYGLFVWVAMNFVVVPLTRVTAAPVRASLSTALMILIHLFVIGVPISWLARRHYDRR
jgi:hypothetical protein